MKKNADKHFAIVNKLAKPIPLKDGYLKKKKKKAQISKLQKKKLTLAGEEAINQPLYRRSKPICPTQSFKWAEKGIKVIHTFYSGTFLEREKTKNKCKKKPV